MTNKEKLNRLISSCDYLEHQEDYDDLFRELEVLEIFKRLATSAEVWKNVEFGTDENRLYIDGDVTYKDEEEKKLFLDWLKENE